MAEAPKLLAAPGAEGDRKPRLSPAARVFQIVFLIGWLIAWTSGIVMAAAAAFALEGPPSLFLVGWLIAALAGWVAAFGALVTLLRGRDPKEPW